MIKLTWGCGHMLTLFRHENPRVELLPPSVPKLILDPPALPPSSIEAVCIINLIIQFLAE
jgi:hypothetical protein